MSADPQVMAYIGDGSTLTTQQARATYETVSRGWGRGPLGLFAIERVSDQRFIGFCGLSEPTLLPEILPSIELGWRLHRSAWNQGFGTEAAQAVADWAFERQDLDRLVSVIHVENTASQRLAVRLGMTQERRTVVPSSALWVDVYELRDQTT